MAFRKAAQEPFEVRMLPELADMLAHGAHLTLEGSPRCFWDLDTAATASHPPATLIAHRTSLGMPRRETRTVATRDWIAAAEGPLEALSYHDLDGRPGFKLALTVKAGRHFLYVSHLWHSGWSVLDVTEP